MGTNRDRPDNHSGTVQTDATNPKISGVEINYFIVPFSDELWRRNLESKLHLASNMLPHYLAKF